jgi:hypothetical protein
VYALAAVALVGVLRFSETSAARRIGWILCALVLGGAAYQLAWLGRDVVTGDGSIARLVVSPRYPPLRIPPSDRAALGEATGRLTADFAQVYFPARAETPLAYAYHRSSSLDPWTRNSRFAPLVHAACGWTVCLLPYGWASLAHLVLQLALLGYTLVRARALLALPRESLPTMLALATACLCLAPVGLAFLERGQWSVYVGLGYCWLVLGLLLDRPRFVVAAAVLAFLKWTSLPFTCVVLGTHVLSGGSLDECRRRARPALIFAATFAALFVCLPEAGMAFFDGLQRQELGSNSNGLSLVLFLPRPVVKLLPFALAGIGAIGFRGRAPSDPALVPFAAGAAILLLGYPTVAHDYSLPSILGFLPLVAYWARSGAVPEPLGSLASAGFGLFLVLASWSTEVFGSPPAVVAAYVVASAALIGSAFASVSAPRPAR